MDDGINWDAILKGNNAPIIPLGSLVAQESQFYGGNNIIVPPPDTLYAPPPPTTAYFPPNDNANTFNAPDYMPQALYPDLKPELAQIEEVHNIVPEVGQLEEIIIPPWETSIPPTMLDEW